MTQEALEVGLVLPSPPRALLLRFICGFSREIDPSFHSSVDAVIASEYAQTLRLWRSLRGPVLDGKVDQTSAKIHKPAATHRESSAVIPGEEYL